MFMKTYLPTGFISLLLLSQTLTAQIQWYQNQDGQNQLPYGTYAGTVQNFTDNSFVASYLWQVTDNIYTWKISRTTLSGQELRSFFVSGAYANAEIKTDQNKAVYVLEKKNNEQEQLVSKIYKLNTNLQPVKEKLISLPNGFQLNSINAFELDGSGNVYLAGDGQYNNNGTISYASFVWKLDKNLQSKWVKTDAVETSFARLHVEPGGKVLVIEDHASLFPALRVKRYSSNGALLQTRMVQTDPARYSLSSTMDKNGNWYIYGGKMAGDTAQAVYLQKMKRYTSAVRYSKTYNHAPISQLNDLRVDAGGNLFMVNSLFTFEEGDMCTVSRINGGNGNYTWNRSFRFADDSCFLSKVVMNENSRFYVVGEKRGQSYFSKGFALQLHKNGTEEARLISPDSVAFQRSHILANGISDKNNQLVAVGNTMDFDTLTYNNTYQRAFAVRFTESGNGCGEQNKGAVESITTARVAEESITMEPQLSVYPNPVQQVMTVSNLNKEGYDQLAIYTMQGAKLLQQNVQGDISRIDVGHLADAVYLLVLRSSVTLKEKTIKFVVRK
jgi:hypothetical protein